MPRLNWTDAVDLFDGARLDERALDYCEKARDICLLAVCGSFERGDVNDKCWKECTSRRYGRCKVRQAP